MADRYWVGGTATWDGTAGTKWALTSGGIGGQAVPTAADDVFFDATSGAVTVTIGSPNSVGIKSLNCTGFTGVLQGFGALNLYGSLTFNPAMTVTTTGVVNFLASATLTSAGKPINGGISIDGAGITVSLADALSIGTGRLSVNKGTFTTNSYNITAGNFVNNISFAQTINLGSSTVTLSSNSPMIFAASANLTINAGTSTIILSGSSAKLNNSGAIPLELANVSFTNTTAGTREVLGLHTFNNLTATAPTSAGVVQITFAGPQTINGTLSTTGTAGNRRVWFRGATYGIAQTLTVNSTPSLTDADFRDIYVVGTAAPVSGTRIGDLRGCSGITFSAPKTVYWNLGGTSATLVADAWSATSGGSVSTDNFPLAQDAAVFDNNSTVPTGNIITSVIIPYIGTIDMSSRTTAIKFQTAANPFAIYGNFICGSGTTIIDSGTLTFSGRNTQTITSLGKTFSGGLIVDSYGGTVELADALNIGSNTLTATNGTFDTKGYAVTAGSLSSSNSNVRGITLGSSTVTLSTGGTPINLVTSTNLAYNSGTSTLNITGQFSGSNFNFGSGLTHHNVNFTSTGVLLFTITAVPLTTTFNNFSITAPASQNVSVINFAGDNIINGTLTVAGATAVRRICVRSDTTGTTRTLTVNSLSADDCDFRDITIAGAAAGSSPTRAGDCGGNTGITFPAAKTVYWNLSGAQNWSATAWASSSGGTPDVNQFPLSQDTAVFDDTGSVTGAITINARWNIGTFNASPRTSAMTLTTTTSNTPTIYGNWLFGTGVTSTSSTATIFFAGRGTQTITSNGVTFGCNISITGTVQLADALALNSSRGLIIGRGTFDAVNYNVTCGTVSTGSSIRTLKMGSGTWTISGTGTVWSTSADNLTFYKGTANIVLSGTSTSARTFTGGGLSYDKLTIGGTTGTSTLTITGNNQFTELASTKTVAHTIDLGTTIQTFGKWSVSGTAGNVVTLTGTGTSHVIAGACTSGIDYLAMGSIGFAATSPGEFYAGANSTGTAIAPVYRTAKPAESTRYWVGGTGSWSDTARWSDSSGGAGGASVPRSHDDVVFDSASNATAYTATVNAVTGGIRTKALTIAGPASGNLTLAGSTAIAGIHSDVTLPATGLTRTYTGAITLSGSATGRTLTTNGVALSSAIAVNGVDCAWSLGSAFSTSNSFINTNGSIDFAGYAVSISFIVSATANSRTFNFGASTITLTGSGGTSGLGTTEEQRANLTLIPGTSELIFSGSNAELVGNNQTFYNVSFTSTSVGTPFIRGANTFNNLSFTGITAAGLKNISLTADQTINGTLTLSAGTDATMRTFLRSDVLGTPRTLTCAAFSGTDADFRDIEIAGAAAPVSGTRLGDCKGNTGITFDAAKTVWWRAGTANWSSNSWSFTDAGALDLTAFPLAQDTAIFGLNYPTNGRIITINAAYNIGTIDMSARTTNTMTLAMGSNRPTIYGNWINGTGTTLTGTGAVTFAGRGSQTLTSAGKTFTQAINVDSPSGLVTLQDACIVSSNGVGAMRLDQGILDANSYNVTLSGSVSTFIPSGSRTRTLSFGSGTWTFAGQGTTFTAVTSTNLTVTGTGTISLTSASAKTFAGGDVEYSGITLDQAGAGTLTITGNNTFKDITNTYSVTGATAIALGTTTQKVANFTANGTVGKVLTITGTSATSPATLIFTGTGQATQPTTDYLNITGIRAYDLTDTWYAGANSTNNGSLGWLFETGSAGVLSNVYYGAVNITSIYYGNTPVSTIYYGSTQVY